MEGMLFIFPIRLVWSILVPLQLEEVVEQVMFNMPIMEEEEVQVMVRPLILDAKGPLPKVGQVQVDKVWGATGQSPALAGEVRLEENQAVPLSDLDINSIFNPKTLLVKFWTNHVRRKSLPTCKKKGYQARELSLRLYK